MDALDTFEINNVEVKIYQDEVLTESPREWSNLGTMTCFHRRYNLGDTPEEYYQKDANAFVDWLQTNKHNLIYLPLYLYDHGGITMRTGKFSCQWDSGQVGYIYVTKEKVREEYGWKLITNKRRLKILEYLENEVKTYDKYLTGEVYGYIATCKECGQEIDSCWGYYDDYGFPCIKQELANIRCHDCIEHTQELFAHAMELIE